MVEMASFKKQEKFVWKLIKKLKLDPEMFHVKQSKDDNSYASVTYDSSRVIVSYEVVLTTMETKYDRYRINCWNKIAKIAGLDMTSIPMFLADILHELGHILNNSYEEDELAEMEILEFRLTDKSRWTLREIYEDYSHISTERLANEWMIRKLSDPDFYKWAMDTWEAI